MKKVTDKQLDDLWGKIIRSRGKCEVCAKTGGLNAHHIFTRSNKSTRWDLENGICLCVYHHIWGNFSAHKSPLDFYEWLKQMRGVKWFNNLRKKSQKSVKCDNIFRTKIKILLEDELTKL